MTFVLIIANGNVGPKQFYRKFVTKADTIVATDGAADYCLKEKITPDVIIGDMDSISVKAQKKFKQTLIKQTDQNTTDLQKALFFIKKYKPTKVVILGAIGNRMDHTLANILSLQKCDYSVEIVDPKNKINIVTSSIQITGKKGDTVSVIAVSKVVGLSYKGLKYTVTNKTVQPGWIGTSNELSKSKATITLKKGEIIVIQSRD